MSHIQPVHNYVQKNWMLLTGAETAVSGTVVLGPPDEAGTGRGIIGSAVGDVILTGVHQGTGRGAGCNDTS